MALKAHIGEAVDSAIRMKICETLGKYASAHYAHEELNEGKPDRDNMADGLADAIYEELQLVTHF